MINHEIFKTVFEHKKYKKEIKNLLKTQLPDYLKSLAKSEYTYRLCGYIPNFNDGEVCEFVLLEPEFKFKNEKILSDEEDREFFDSYYIKNKENIRIVEKIENQIEKLPKEFFTIVYGNNFQLEISVDKIKKSYCEHD